MRSVSDKIIETITEAGIDHIFTIPGGAMSPIFPALGDYQDQIKVILTRNEQTASCMAEMYGRLTGKPGLIAGQGPFVASAGLFGLMEGYLTSTPMLALADVTEYGSFALHAPFQCGTGDYGGLAMQIHALSTAKQFGAPAIFVVMNDSVLGAVRDGQEGRPIASEFIDTDFAKIAQAFDCQGVRVKAPDQIGPALEAALKSKDPFVIDILTDRDERIRDKVRAPWAKKALEKI